jgi:hypothetical protein
MSAGTVHFLEEKDAARARAIVESHGGHWRASGWSWRHFGEQRGHYIRYSIANTASAKCHAALKEAGFIVKGKFDA